MVKTQILDRQSIWVMSWLCIPNEVRWGCCSGQDLPWRGSGLESTKYKKLSAICHGWLTNLDTFILWCQKLTPFGYLYLAPSMFLECGSYHLSCSKCSALQDFSMLSPSALLELALWWHSSEFLELPLSLFESFASVLTAYTCWVS